MSVSQYDPTQALDQYYPGRDTRIPARHWATEKLLMDLAALGLVSYFKGGGSNPTALTGYAATSVWLKVEAGITSEPGELRVYDGSGTQSLLASWPVATPTNFWAYIKRVYMS